MATTGLNLDPTEIAKFEALAARWWDPDSEFKPLHDINPLRVEFIRQRVELNGKRVLDVGCGGGLLAEAMARLGARVTGIDMGSGPLSVARLHSKESGLDIDYQQRTAENMAVDGAAQFDIVTCMEVLEHVPDPASTVAACAALLKPGGAAFFATINRNPKSWLFAVIGAEYVLGLLPRGTHDYRKFIQPAELDGWARAGGLDVSELIGLHYNPLTDRYWLAPGLDVNYMAYARRADA